METSFSDNVESLQKHWIWGGDPISRPVSVTTWSLSTKTLNMTWWPDMETTFSDNVESLYTHTECEVVNRYWDQFQWHRGVSLQKHWIWGGEPISRRVSVTMWSLSTKTLNMRWWPDIETIFSESMESLYKNTVYEVVTRYLDQFQWQRGVTLQKQWMWARHLILRPVSLTPWSVSTQTLNMRWWPDI